MRKFFAFMAALSALVAPAQLHAANVTKANNTDALNLGTSWVGGVAPGASDVATWDATVADPNNATVDFGVNATWSGVKILNPATTVTITTNSGPTTLTLGGLGIDLSNATTDLTMSNGLALTAGTINALNVPGGRTLSLEGAFSRPSGSLLSVNGDGTINVAGLATGTVLTYCLVNATDCGAIDGSLNLSTIGNVTGYSQNSPGAAPPAATPVDMVNSATGTGGGATATGDDVHLGSTIFFPVVIRFNTPQANRNYWYYNVGSGQNSMAAGATVTVLVTTNVGVSDCIITGTSHAFRWSGSSSSTGAELIIDQENTAGNLFINGAMSQKTASPGNMITKRGAGRVVFNASLVTTGPTRILEGNLMLNGSSVNGSPFIINNAGTLSGAGTAFGPVTNNGTIWPGNTNGAGSLTVSTATLNAGSTLKFYSATTPMTNTTALLNITNLTINGAVNVSIQSGAVALGEYPLIYTPGGFSGAALANLTLASMPPHVSGYLTNNATSSTIDLVLTNVAEPLNWATGNGTWDINGTANWKDATGTTTTYQELNNLGDQVQFEDTLSGSSPITVSLNTTVHPSSVTFNSSKNFTLSGNGQIAGKGGVTISGSGSVTLATENSYSGATVLNGGTTIFSDLNNLGSGPVTFGGGTLQYNGNADDLSTRTVTLASGQSTINVGASTVTFANPIGNNGAGGLTKTGSGMLVLSGTNVYSGNTIVSAGTLMLGFNTFVSNSPALIVNATLDTGSSGGSLTLSPSVNQVLSGIGTVTGNVDVPAGTTLSPATNGVVGTLNLNNDLTVDGGTLAFDVASTGSHDLLTVGGNLTINSGSVLVITNTTPLANGVYKLIQYNGGLLNGPGSSGNLIVQGFNQPGKIAALSDATPNEIDLVVSTLGGASTTWTGNDPTSPGVWDVENTKNFANASHTAVTFVNGDKPTFDDSSAVPNVNLMASVQPGSVTVNSTANNYVFQDGSGTGAGKISGTTGITKNGPSTLTILTLNNNSGATVINGGTVQVGNGSANGDIGTGSIANNGTLIFQQLDNRSVSGAISGSGSLTQQGAGTLTLAQDNTYTGATTISSGALQIGTGAAAGSISPADVLDNGTLSFNRSGNITLPNNITGTGAFATLGSSAIKFSGALTYQGNTFISNGVVQLTANNQIPNGTNVAGSTGWLILDGSATRAGTLDLNGFDQAVNALSGLGGTFTGVITNSGTSTTTTNVLTVFGAAGTTYNGIIADNATGAKTKVVLRGANELRLNGNNTYSGGTIVGDSATIGFGPGASVGSGTLTLSNGTTLSMHSAGSSLAFPTASVFIPDNATVTNFTTSLGNGFAGIITGSESTTNVLMSAGGVGLSYSPGNLKQLQPFLGTLLIPSGQSLRWSPTSGLNNGGDFTTLDLEGSMNAKASGTVAMGALIGVGTIASPSGGTVTWVVGGKNNDSTFPGTITDTPPAHNALTKVGTGKLILTGSVNYSGATTVSNGVLVLATDAATLDNSPSITLAGDNATIDVTGHSDPTFYLGNATPQVLNGFGVINGNLFEQSTTTNNLRPGVLRVTQTATINGALTMQINRTNAVTSAELSAPTFVNGGSIVLTVTNVGSTNLVGGDKFQLFNQAFTGGFVATNLPALPVPGMYWTNNIAVDGSISVVSTVNPTPAPISLGVTNGVLTLTWPADHQGWTLQKNTNGLASPNWQDIPGSTSITTTNIPVDPTAPAIFYRLKF